MKNQLFQMTPPSTPGVYFFKSHLQEILYIGKAKNLHKRIFSYNTDKQIDWKIVYLLEKSTEISWIETNTEKEALIIEAELISIHKPIFNKLLTSDTPFYYIAFSDADIHHLPSITVSRIKKNDSILQMGPFLTKKEAMNLYYFILESFQLFKCKKKIPHGCLNFHIGKCCGICKESFNPTIYKQNFNTALQTIKNPDIIIKKIEKELKLKKKTLDLDNIEKLSKTIDTINSLSLKIHASLSHSNDFQHQLQKTIANIDTKNIEIIEGLNSIKNLLHIKNINKNTIIIDCIDVSHLQGFAASGACIRYTNGIFDQKNSQAYALHNTNNDYENLALIITYHYLHNNTPLPDILLIDGGIGQLNTIQNRFDLPIHYIALAKKEETLFMSSTHTKKLDIHTPMGKLLISLRNMTHSTALLMHRRLRQITHKSK